MKRILLIVFIIAAGIGVYFAIEHLASSPSKKTGSDISHWTCGMHPKVIRKGPGKCPICAMDLVPVKKKVHVHSGKNGKTNAGAHNHGKTGSTSLSNVRQVLRDEIKLDPRSVLLARVRTTRIGYRNLSRTIRTVGKVTYNEKSLAHVAAWIGGRVDRLFVNYTGSYVRRGQALLQIYSPKLISTQEEYITLLKGSKAAAGGNVQKQFINSVRRRLRLLGMTEAQIVRLEKTYKVATHTTIYSPISGTVIKKYVHQGMYFKEGKNFYDIADLSRVWVHADIYEYEMALVKRGQRVKIDLPSHTKPIYGRVTFIDPVLNPTSRTVKVRAEFWNAGRGLKPNMYVNATIDIPTAGKKLAIPRSAVLDTGVRKVVYIEKEPGVYALRNVVLGTLTGDYYPVKRGIRAGERVVTRGAFLIDSQSQLTGGSSLLYGSAEEGAGKKKVHQH